MLTSVDDVIEELGGTASVASLASVGASAVSNWRERRRIPQSCFFLVRDALAAKGKEADPSIFGFKVSEARA